MCLSANHRSFGSNNLVEIKMLRKKVSTLGKQGIIMVSVQRKLFEKWIIHTAQSTMELFFFFPGFSSSFVGYFCYLVAKGVNVLLWKNIEVKD